MNTDLENNCPKTSIPGSRLPIVIFNRIRKICRPILGFFKVKKTNKSCTKLFEEAFKEAVKEWADEINNRR